MEQELLQAIDSAHKVHGAISYDIGYWGETPGRTKQVLHEFGYVNRDKVDKAFIRYLLNGIGFPKQGDHQLKVVPGPDVDESIAQTVLDRLTAVHKLVRLNA